MECHTNCCEFFDYFLAIVYEVCVCVSHYNYTNTLNVNYYCLLHWIATATAVGGGCGCCGGGGGGFVFNNEMNGSKWSEINEERKNKTVYKKQQK